MIIFCVAFYSVTTYTTSTTTRVVEVCRCHFKLFRSKHTH